MHTLVDLALDEDQAVRLGVASSMPSLTGDEPDEPGIAVLIALSRDSDADVRDWATFGLGTQTNAHSPAIRAALWTSSHDAHRETRQEGAVGLAPP